MGRGGRDLQNGDSGNEQEGRRTGADIYARITERIVAALERGRP